MKRALPPRQRTTAWFVVCLFVVLGPPPTFPSTFSAPSWAACAAHRAVTSVSIRTGNTNIRITRWPESWRPSMAPERDAWWTRFLAVSASVAALTGLYWYMSTRDYTVKVSIVHLKDGKPI